MDNVKALCFDTGGTILDWHTGTRTALAAVGSRHGIARDWAAPRAVAGTGWATSRLSWTKPRSSAQVRNVRTYVARETLAT
jgi:FMN phosphatase YigB (HAD superfamily)